MTPWLFRLASKFRPSQHLHMLGAVLVSGLVSTAHAAPAVDAPASPAATAASAAPGPDCGAAINQSATNACAEQAFLAANGRYAERYRALSAALPKAQRGRLRQMQSAWLRYRTEACRFEAGPSEGGSIHAFAYWSCAARMTTARAAELAALAECREGDVTCQVVRP